MFLPAVTTRIEKTTQTFCNWITRSPLFALKLIAEWTTETEIGKFRCAAYCLRNNVVKMKRRHRQFLRCQAVFATILCRFNNLLAKFRRNARHNTLSVSFFLFVVLYAGCILRA